MIFVTVGTDEHDFSRLIKKADSLKGLDIVAQIGNTKYTPKNIKHFKFLEPSALETYYRKADVIITHGGAGSIINSLKNGKIPIVVPRLKKFDEHINDHQLQLAKSLQEKGKAVCVIDMNKLEYHIKTSKTIKMKQSKEKRNLIQFLAGTLKAMEK